MNLAKIPPAVFVQRIKKRLYEFIIIMYKCEVLCLPHTAIYLIGNNSIVKFSQELPNYNKTLIGPVLKYSSEDWIIPKTQEQVFFCFERRTLRVIFRAV